MGPGEASMIGYGLRPMPPSEGAVPGEPLPDDDDISRRMLDGLLGGRPERVLRYGERVCLATPRGLEVVSLPDYRRLPRVDPGCRLLGAALVDGGIVLLDETGRLSRWEDGDELRTILPAGGPTARCRHLRGDGGRVLLGCGSRLELRDAVSGSLRAAGRVDFPGRISALALGEDDTVLAARSQGVAVLRPAGDALIQRALFTVDEGEVLALAETRLEPDGPPHIVAFDEFGWLHVLRHEGDQLRRVGSVELELDGGAPERGGLSCDGPMVTVASGTRMLHLVDLRGPGGHDDPVPMAAISVGTGLADVTHDEDRVYLADAFHGLVVVDRQLLQVCDDDPVLGRVALHDNPVR
jgi:hypothetical protein